MSTNCIVCIKNERTGSDLLCDDCRMLDYEAKCVASIPEEKKKLAAEFLAKELPRDFKEQSRKLIEEGKDRFWFSSYHFTAGMKIRNILRGHGFSEKELGIENLDFIYCKLLERAIMGSEVDWEEKDETGD